MKQKNNAWGWIPTLYFAEGLPYFAVMTMAVIMYQNLGLGDKEIAFYTSWLGMPWVIKPIWSPFIDLVRTKRFWVLSMQGLMAAAFTLYSILSADQFFCSGNNGFLCTACFLIGYPRYCR